MSDTPVGSAAKNSHEPDGSFAPDSGPNLEGTVAVAMSGGLDSSVVAWMLAQKPEVRTVGLSMLLWDHSLERRNGRCCGALDLADAQRVSAQIGIPHYTLQMDADFRRTVVDPFVQDYLDGRTPSPCVRCNTWVKFDLFVERARALGATTIATGHYARIFKGDNGLELHTAADLDKDQSYFLFELTQEQLAVSHFPLGEMSKSEARSLARQAGLVVAEKSESMDVCFVTTGVRDFVEKQVELHPDRYRMPKLEQEPAEIVNSEGQSLGRSRDPYYRYTVGQRRGLNLASDGRLYVLNVDSERNRVTVGNDQQLEQEGLVGSRSHWIGPRPAGAVKATVKIRSRHPGVECVIEDLGDGRSAVRFAEPQRGVAPGQAAVFYDGTRVLGGCWIETALQDVDSHNGTSVDSSVGIGMSSV